MPGNQKPQIWPFLDNLGVPVFTPLTIMAKCGMQEWIHTLPRYISPWSVFPVAPEVQNRKIWRYFQIRHYVTAPSSGEENADAQSGYKPFPIPH